MYLNKKIAVVIPTYKSASKIQAVIQTLPSFVDHIVVVDDNCPEGSGKLIERLSMPKVNIIFHEVNQGVGGATISGYKASLNLDAEVIVKVDSDGQMDPKSMDKLLNSIIKEKYSYAKGNRFGNLKDLRMMPAIRIFGNSILSFAVKVASGYWNIMDPTNGYTAISREALSALDLSKISRNYFFESSMLVYLNVARMPVKDINMKAIYADEKSSLNILLEFFRFPLLLFKFLLIRIFYRYFLYDFNMGSVYLTVGSIMFFYGSFLGFTTWYENSLIGVSSPIGTIFISFINIILGVQFILQAINIDILNTPKVSDNH